MLSPNHVTLDLIGVKPESIGDISVVRSYLKQCVVHMGMNAVGEPNIMYFQGQDELTSGITGTQVIAESLIDFHGYTKEGVAYISLFSCKPFDRMKLYHFTQTFWQAEAICLNSVRRYSIRDNIIKCPKTENLVAQAVPTGETVDAGISPSVPLSPVTIPR